MNRLSMTDLLFNVLMAITLMFMVLLLILNTKESDPAIEDRNRLVITTEWDGTSNYDVDLWVQAPDGSIAGFSNKEMGGMFLQRDDTGSLNPADNLELPDGTIQYIALNREIMNVRKLQPGRYIVNVVLYSTKEGATHLDPSEAGITYGEVTVKSGLIQPDPFADWSGREAVLVSNCDQATVLMFDVAADDKVTVVEDPPFVRMSLSCRVPSLGHTGGSY